MSFVNDTDRPLIFRGGRPNSLFYKFQYRGFTWSGYAEGIADAKRRGMIAYEAQQANLKRIFEDPAKTPSSSCDESGGAAAPGESETARRLLERV